MKRVRHLVPPATWYQMYQTLIQPYFDYFSIVWGSCGVASQDDLQKFLQNRAARILNFSNCDVNASQLLEILGSKNLDREQNIQKATMVIIHMATWVSSTLFGIEIS